MARIRAFESAAERLYDEKRIPGFAHLSTGLEAIPAGVCANLAASDQITSTHRGHGHTIAKGGDVLRMMLELFGRAGGYCQGKGGSMHIADILGGTKDLVRSAGGLREETRSFASLGMTRRGTITPRT